MKISSREELKGNVTRLGASTEAPAESVNSGVRRNPEGSTTEKTSKSRMSFCLALRSLLVLLMRASASTRRVASALKAAVTASRLRRRSSTSNSRPNSPGEKRKDPLTSRPASIGMRLKWMGSRRGTISPFSPSVSSSPLLDLGCTVERRLPWRITSGRANLGSA